MKMLIMLAIAPIVSIMLLLVMIESARLYVVEEVLAPYHGRGTDTPEWLTRKHWQA